MIFSARGSWVSSVITPDREILRQLRRVSWTEKKIKVDFDESLVGSRVIWDEADDELVIKEVPEEVQRMLRKLSGNVE